MARARVAQISAEEAETLKLEAGPRGNIGKTGLDDCVGHHDLGILVDKVEPVCGAFHVVRVGDGEQAVVQADLGRCRGHARRGLGNPVEHTLALDGGVRQICGLDFGRFAVLVDREAVASDVEGVAQDDLLVGCKAVKFLVVLGTEIRVLNVHDARDGHLAVGRGLDDLDLVLGPVGEHDAQRVDDCKCARAGVVHLDTGIVLEDIHVDHVCSAGDTDLLDKGIDCVGRVALAAEAHEGGHARVVPAADVALLDKLLELALGHDGVRQIEARELPDHGLVHARGIEEPHVRVVAHLELERAQRMCDVLERVVEAVCVVIGRVDAPCVADMRMRRELDAPCDGIAEHRVVVLHVHLETQDGGAFVVLALAHVLKDLAGLGARAVAVGRVDLLFAVAVHLVGGLVARKRKIALNEIEGDVVQLLHVVGGICDLGRGPAEPLDIVDD
eukprot:comp9473_c0_seq1/m.10979 comp9473_c0_seq1/g.10979  ORF comp9473_c0_seq1/g.10979 comp9473_c0_seq1/m.10979 type:complete len:444 (+) comp9473_c0_seq1:140-1471(+)